ATAPTGWSEQCSREGLRAGREPVSRAPGATGIAPARTAQAHESANQRIASDLFLDPSGLAGQIAQVVQLRAPDAATALDRDVADGRAVCLEDTLHALSVRDLPDGERGVQSAVADRNHDTLVRLDTLAVAFHHLHLHDHRVTGLEIRHLAGHAR